MPVDRQSIEKRDFPISRRGYDADAVDAHLATLADEFEATQRQLRRRSSESIAQAASEQVRAIVEAAERSASDIERAAEEEAASIRAEANRDAERTRNEAIERARGHVGDVSSASQAMLQRVEAMQSELDKLIESLRTGSNRLGADLSLLETNMGELYRAAGAQAGATPIAADAEPESVRSGATTPELESFEEVDAEPEPAVATATAEEALAAEPVTDAEPGEAGDGDVEGARLIALNMALNGQSREETDRYLADNFDLADRQGLLDEVYASVEG